MIGVQIFFAGILGTRRPRRSAEPTRVGSLIYKPTRLSLTIQMTSNRIICASRATFPILALITRSVLLKGRTERMPALQRRCKNIELLYPALFVMLHALLSHQNFVMDSVRCTNLAMPMRNEILLHSIVLLAAQPVAAPVPGLLHSFTSHKLQSCLFQLLTEVVIF